MRFIPLATTTVLLAGLFLGAACGGGGSGEPPPPSEGALLEMGLVPSSVPTTGLFQVTNTTTGDMTVTGAGEFPPFRFAPGQFPLTLPSGASTNLEVVFTPTGAGMFGGWVSALLTPLAGAASLSEVYVSAQAEAVSTIVHTTTLDFGDVLPGSSSSLPIQVTNLSHVSPAIIRPPVFPSAAFSISSPSLPLNLAPGATTSLTVLYQPTTPGTPTGDITLDTSDADGPTTISLGGSSGGQDIVDFGTVDFDGFGDTAELTFDVPADAISFMIEARTNAGSSAGLRLLTGPGGRVYENLTTTGPYIWTNTNEYFNAQVPNTDRNEVQLVPGGGTYRLRLMLWSGSDNNVDVRVIIERRPAPGTTTVGTLDLNVFLANAITPTAATAAGDGPLQAVLSAIDTILQQQGIHLGDIDYYDINDSRYDDVSSSEFGPMLATSSVASEVRLNLFFVRQTFSGGVLGVAATLGGPSRNGTTLSGVMSTYATSSTAAFTGLIAAHEICHFLGLDHTAEQNGQHDDILDTAACPANGAGGPCAVAGGGYLMHWQAVGGQDITGGQGWIIRGHPLLSPAAAPVGALSAKFQESPAPILVPAGVSPNWCGTCQCEHPAKPN